MIINKWDEQTVHDFIAGIERPWREQLEQALKALDYTLTVLLYDRDSIPAIQQAEKMARPILGGKKWNS